MDKTKNNQCYKIFHQNGETVIHFNPEVTPLSDDDLSRAEGAIHAKSGGGILLIIKHAKYGILYIQENSLIPPDRRNITVEEAIKMVIEKITVQTAATNR